MPVKLPVIDYPSLSGYPFYPGFMKGNPDLKGHCVQSHFVIFIQSLALIIRSLKFYDKSK